MLNSFKKEKLNKLLSQVFIFSAVVESSLYFFSMWNRASILGKECDQKVSTPGTRCHHNRSHDTCCRGRMCHKPRKKYVCYLVLTDYETSKKLADVF